MERKACIHVVLTKAWGEISIELHVRARKWLEAKIRVDAVAESPQTWRAPAAPARGASRAVKMGAVSMVPRAGTMLAVAAGRRRR